MASQIGRNGQAPEPFAGADTQNREQQTGMIIETPQFGESTIQSSSSREGSVPQVNTTFSSRMSQCFSRVIESLRSCWVGFLAFFERRTHAPKAQEQVNPPQIVPLTAIASELNSTTVHTNEGIVQLETVSGSNESSLIGGVGEAQLLTDASALASGEENLIEAPSGFS